MTSQLKVDRISPATGSEIIIDGFSSDQPAFYTEISTGNQDLANAVETKVILSSTAQRIDTHSLLDADGRCTITADTAGIWRFTGQVNGYYVNSQQHLQKVFAMIHKNGSKITNEGSDSMVDAPGGGVLKSQTQTVTVIAEVSAGDYIELYGSVQYASTASPMQIAQRSTNFSGNRISS